MPNKPQKRTDHAKSGISDFNDSSRVSRLLVRISDELFSPLREQGA